MLIIGDSFVVSAFGSILQRELNKAEGVRTHRKGKSSSGLARPDFFDWMAVAGELVRAHDPHLVVVLLGGNDGQDLLGLDGRSGRVRFRTPAWPEAYKARTGSFLDVLQAGGREVLWLGLPAMGAPNFERKVESIRQLHQEVIAARSGARYLDSPAFFKDARGKLRPTARLRHWKTPRGLREDDGIHFTVAGGEFFAHRVLPHVLEALGRQPLIATDER